MPSPLLLWHRDPSTAVLVQAGGSPGDGESLPALAGALGPGWEPLQSPARVSAKATVGSHRGKTSWKRCCRAQPGWQGSEGIGGLGAVEMEGQTGDKGASKNTVSTDPLRSSESMAGCVGQSLRCRVLGEETSGTGARRRAAEGTGSPVCHVPWVLRTWGSGESGDGEDHPAREVSRVQVPRRGSTESGVPRIRGPQGGGEPGMRNHPGCRFPGGAELGFSAPGAGDGPGRGVAGDRKSVV